MMVLVDRTCFREIAHCLALRFWPSYGVIGGVLVSGINQDAACRCAVTSDCTW